jgi:hypothetical protein
VEGRDSVQDVHHRVDEESEGKTMDVIGSV